MVYASRLLRKLILSLAVRIHMQEAEKRAVELFVDLRNNGHKIVPNFRRFCYAAGVHMGTNRDWNFAWKMYNETKVASERNLWMRALAASPHVYVLQQ